MTPHHEGVVDPHAHRRKRLKSSTAGDFCLIPQVDTEKGKELQQGKVEQGIEQGKKVLVS